MGLGVKGFTAVMARRREPPDALDYFPTPLWATHVLQMPLVGARA